MEDELEGVVVPETTEESTPEVEEEETLESVKDKLAKAQEIAENQRIRAEKAEKKSKENPMGTPDLSTKDVLFLAKADIHEDDMDDVLEWAKFKKVPVSEAYKQLKGTLEARKEERKTAEVANIATTRRSAPKVDGTAILERAKAGSLPDDDESIAKLMEARLRNKG